MTCPSRWFCLDYTLSTHQAICYHSNLIAELGWERKMDTVAGLEVEMENKVIEAA